MLRSLESITTLEPITTLVRFMFATLLVLTLLTAFNPAFAAEDTSVDLGFVFSWVLDFVAAGLVAIGGAIWFYIRKQFKLSDSVAASEAADRALRNAVNFAINKLREAAKPYTVIEVKNAFLRNALRYAFEHGGPELAKQGILDTDAGREKVVEKILGRLTPDDFKALASLTSSHASGPGGGISNP